MNGVSIVGICSKEKSFFEKYANKISLLTDKYDLLLDSVDAVYVISHPSRHYFHVKKALEAGKHVLCESPIAMSTKESDELYFLARSKKLTLVDAIKTAYSTAYSRMILLAKSGKIGDIVSVDSVCTSLRNVDYNDQYLLQKTWNSITSWGPTASLPIFQLLGTEYSDIRFVSRIGDNKYAYDEFTKITFEYPKAVASVKVGQGVKSEGELIISGTKGYIYVPAPWWKTDYFELRYENPTDNKRYFFQLDGEGIRNEIVSFLRIIENKGFSYVSEKLSSAISLIMELYMNGHNLIRLIKD